MRVRFSDKTQTLNPQEIDLMAHLHRPFLSAIALLLCSCSPKIYTQIQNPHTPRETHAEVIVYDLNTQTPPSAQFLGGVAIKDSGFSTHCNYDQVLNLAKVETNKAGGNALHITWWKRPSFWGSSCHQISGEIVLIPDSLYLQLCSSPDGSHPTTMHANDSSMANLAERPSPRTSNPRRSRHHFYVEAGYSFIYSKWDNEMSLEKDPRHGLNTTSGYQILSQSGFGGGVRYSGYFSSSPFSYQKEMYHMQVLYFAPEFAMQHQFGKWNLHESIGIGYAIYREQMGNQSGSVGGLGTHLCVGVNYCIHPNIALGLSIGNYATRFFSLDKIIGEHFNSSETKAGINRIAISAGVYFHF